MLINHGVFEKKGWMDGSILVGKACRPGYTRDHGSIIEGFEHKLACGKFYDNPIHNMLHTSWYKANDPTDCRLKIGYHAHSDDGSACIWNIWAKCTDP